MKSGHSCRMCNSQFASTSAVNDGSVKRGHKCQEVRKYTTPNIFSAHLTARSLIETTNTTNTDSEQSTKRHSLQNKSEEKPNKNQIIVRPPINPKYSSLNLEFFCGFPATDDERLFRGNLDMLKIKYTRVDVIVNGATMLVNKKIVVCLYFRKMSGAGKTLKLKKISAACGTLGNQHESAMIITQLATGQNTDMETVYHDAQPFTLVTTRSADETLAAICQHL